MAEFTQDLHAIETFIAEAKALTSHLVSLTCHTFRHSATPQLSLSAKNTVPSYRAESCLVKCRPQDAAV